MYGEHFDVPTPDELVLSAWFQSGQIFRCGCVWRRGYGKVFYFQPGHETYPPTTKTSMCAPSSATPCAMWPALLG